MVWLYIWIGLLVGWLLLLIFMVGMVSYYCEEISCWMCLELLCSMVDVDVVVECVIIFLQYKVFQVESWNVSLFDLCNFVMWMFWCNFELMVKLLVEGEKCCCCGGGCFGDVMVDFNSGQEVVVCEICGGDFFYCLYFDLYYILVLWVCYFVGFCVMFMLVVIIIGVIIYKKIFKDFFMFWKDKGLCLWLDFYNVSVVMVLFYYVMIIYMGIVILMFMYLLWGVSVVYFKDEDVFFSEVFVCLVDIDMLFEGCVVVLLIQQLLDSVCVEWKGVDVGGFILYYLGVVNVVIDIQQCDGKCFLVDMLLLCYNVVIGVLFEVSLVVGGVIQICGVMYGLYLVCFVDWGLCVLFFLFGLVGCLMVVSGVVLWVVKEWFKYVKLGKIGFGLCLVDVFNIGVVVGLLIVFVMYFWGNWLLLLQMVEWLMVEVDVFFYVWGVVLLVVFIWFKWMMWVWQLYLGVVLFVLILVVNVLIIYVYLGVILCSGDWVLVGFDFIMFVFGVMFVYCGLCMQCWQLVLSVVGKKWQVVVKVQQYVGVEVGV